MGSGLRDKKNKSEWEYYIPLKEDFEAMEYCIKNNIRISITPMERGLNPKNFKISIAIGAYKKGEKVNLSPKTYSKEDIIQEMYNAAKYYYKKYENKI